MHNLTRTIEFKNFDRGDHKEAFFSWKISIGSIVIPSLGYAVMLFQTTEAYALVVVLMLAVIASQILLCSAMTTGIKEQLNSAICALPDASVEEKNEIINKLDMYIAQMNPDWMDYYAIVIARLLKVKKGLIHEAHLERIPEDNSCNHTARG